MNKFQLALVSHDSTDPGCFPTTPLSSYNPLREDLQPDPQTSLISNTLLHFKCSMNKLQRFFLKNRSTRYQLCCVCRNHLKRKCVLYSFLHPYHLPVVTNLLELVIYKNMLGVTHHHRRRLDVL